MALALHVLDHDLIEPGGSASMLASVSAIWLCSRLATDDDEDPQVPDLIIHHVEDALAADLDLELVGIGVEDPVQRLGRRG